MHYKNGRPASIGDWVVGPTHNSEGKLLVGMVMETMPEQGPCNVRLYVFPWYESRLNMTPESSSDWERDGCRVWTGKEKAYGMIAGREDFADAAKLIHVNDGHRMVAAFEDFGRWTSHPA